MRSALLCASSAERIIYNFAILENLRIFQNCLFTGGVVEGNCICSAAFCESAALRIASSPSQALPRQLSQRESQAITFVAKVLGETRKFPAVLLALPLGELSPQVTERAISPTEKGCPPIGRQPFPEENKENTRPKGQSEYQNMLSSL